MSEATILPFPTRLRLAPVAQPEEVLAGEGKSENIAPAKPEFGKRPRRAALLAGALTEVRDALRAEARKAKVCPSLIASSAARMECLAQMARALGDEMKSYGDLHSAVTLRTIADVLETRAAAIEPQNPEAS